MQLNNTSILKVNFKDFWPNASDTIHNFFLPLIQEATSRHVIRVNSDEVADISVRSVFPRNKSLKEIIRDKLTVPPVTSPIQIWYSGENIRAPFSGYDLTWGFDVNKYSGTNFYLPVWFLDLDLFVENVNPNLGFPLHYKELMTARTCPAIPERFACVIANNPHPHRMRAIEALSSIGKVDVYGKLGNLELRSKSEIRNKYRYVIAFENDFFPGYVTEKLFHAWSIGSVPVYWGSDVMNYVNQDAIISLSPEANFEELSARIMAIEENRNSWMSIYSAPILNKKPFLGDILDSLQKILLRCAS